MRSLRCALLGEIVKHWRFIDFFMCSVHVQGVSEMNIEATFRFTDGFLSIRAFSE